jgi:hypothetical protein
MFSCEHLQQWITADCSSSSTGGNVITRCRQSLLQPIATAAARPPKPLLFLMGSNANTLIIFAFPPRPPTRQSAATSCTCANRRLPTIVTTHSSSWPGWPHGSSSPLGAYPSSRSRLALCRDSQGRCEVRTHVGALVGQWLDVIIIKLLFLKACLIRSWGWYWARHQWGTDGDPLWHQVRSLWFAECSSLNVWTWLGGTGWWYMDSKDEIDWLQVSVMMLQGAFAISAVVCIQRVIKYDFTVVVFGWLSFCYLLVVVDQQFRCYEILCIANTAENCSGQHNSWKNKILMTRLIWNSQISEYHSIR